MIGEMHAEVGQLVADSHESAVGVDALPACHRGGDAFERACPRLRAQAVE